MAATKVRLKLLIDKKNHRVLFAEADNKFVDFLFSILTLPVGTVTRLLLLKEEKLAGCLHSLYESIENLDGIYIQPGQDKDFLLNPKLAISGARVPLLLPSVKQSYTAVTDWKFYKCGNSNCKYFAVANDPRAICPVCTKKMNSELRYVDYPPNDIKASSSCEGGGYVKGMITYMVMDDLDVKPMSTISAITLLCNFNVRDVGDVEEKVVDFGMDEGVKLLKASLQSKTVLTDVFFPAEATTTGESVKKKRVLV